MTRLVVMLMLMLVGTSVAHAQGSPQISPTGQAPAGMVPALPQAPQVPQAQPQVPQVAGEPSAMEPQVMDAPSNGTTEAAATAPDRQSLMRELQEQGREAATKARVLQATDPVAANKVMQDYYQLRSEKMREIQKTARTQAVEQRAQKREQVKVKEAAAQAERAAVRRDEKNGRDKQRQFDRGFRDNDSRDRTRKDKTQ